MCGYRSFPLQFPIVPYFVNIIIYRIIGTSSSTDRACECLRVCVVNRLSLTHTINLLFARCLSNRILHAVFFAKILFCDVKKKKFACNFSLLTASPLHSCPVIIVTFFGIYSEYFLREAGNRFYSSRRGEMFNLPLPYVSNGV